ncbi:PAS domain S-box protein [Halobellus sp. Atlit-31R]|nr:PAS domain S-box protein [Halobellus sp. Atlit-31R]
MSSDSYRERLYDVFADPDRETDEKIARALEIGSEFLGLPIGFFTRIDDGILEIVQSTGEHPLLQPGEQCPIEEAYCQQTVKLDEPFATHDAAASSISERAVEMLGLGTYIGAQIVVNDELYGTVCFADEDERDDPFSEAEEVFQELLAKLVSSELERGTYEREIERRNEQLKREKQRFEGIAEASFDILFRLDLDAEFTYVSSAAERILGNDPEEVIGQPLTQLMTDEAAEKAVAGYSRILDGEEVARMELDFLDQSGEVVVLEVNATPVTEDGEIVGVQGVGRDITARKERQRELRVKNRAIEEAQVGISIADLREPDNPLVYVNNGFERLTGYDAVEATGRNCRFLQGEATDPEKVSRLRSAIDAGEPVSVEIVNYRKDGTPFWNRARLAPVENDAGTVTHYLGFQDDITERKRTSELIQLLNRVLRHNLRNDLNAILGWNGERRAGSISEKRPEDRVDDIARELVELSERARELEQYARGDRTPQRLAPDPLVSAVVTGQRNADPAATIEQTVRTERDICAGPELRRAVRELVENAVKHADSPAPQVAIDVADAGEWIELTVVDDGPGIDEMEAAVISSGNETALQHGSGLGLWLVNWIVTRYGGSFRIHTGDEGTTATIRLPAIDDTESVASVARRPTVLFR